MRNKKEDYSLEKFRERLNYSMKINELTVNDLANKISCSRQLIYNWKKGTTTPSLNDMIKLCNILNVSIDWLSGSSEFINTGVIPIELNQVPKLQFTYNGKVISPQITKLLNNVLYSVANNLIQ